MGMKYKVTYLPLANQDILRISKALENYPNKAKRLFQEMENKLKMLEDMPYRWPAFRMKPEYRQMVLEDHLLFYLVDEDEHAVKIYRVLYEKMDMPKHI